MKQNVVSSTKTLNRTSAGIFDYHWALKGYHGNTFLAYLHFVTVAGSSECVPFCRHNLSHILMFCLYSILSTFLYVLPFLLYISHILTTCVFLRFFVCLFNEVISNGHAILRVRRRDAANRSPASHSKART